VLEIAREGIYPIKLPLSWIFYGFSKEAKSLENPFSPARGEIGLHQHCALDALAVAAEKMQLFLGDDHPEMIVRL
jgi:hypothetical protein